MLELLIIVVFGYPDNLASIKCEPLRHSLYSCEVWMGGETVTEPLIKDIDMILTDYVVAAEEFPIAELCVAEPEEPDARCTGDYLNWES